MRPRAVPITLTAAEQAQLERWARARSTPARLQTRARIVLGAAQGLSNLAITRTLGVSLSQVRRWRGRVAQEGALTIAQERPRGGNHGGKNSADQARLRSRVLTVTTQEKPPHATRWTVRTLARHLGVPHDFVHRVWRAHGLKPHLIRSFQLSRDPDFEAKLRDVVGLYLHPPDKAAVFCFDEKSQIQALDRTQPGLPLKPGRGGTRTHDYKRHGTTTLFAALNVATGEVIGQTHGRHRHEEVWAFLQAVARTVPKDQDIHIILDHYGTHKHPKVLAWIERQGRIFLHFTPTSSSWLNLVERFFATLTQRCLRHGVHTSVAQLERCLHDYVRQHNVNPRPLFWTKNADAILRKVHRARTALAAVS